MGSFGYLIHFAFNFSYKRLIKFDLNKADLYHTKSSRHKIIVKLVTQMLSLSQVPPQNLTASPPMSYLNSLTSSPQPKPDSKKNVVWASSRCWAKRNPGFTSGFLLLLQLFLYAFQCFYVYHYFFAKMPKASGRKIKAVQKLTSKTDLAFQPEKMSERHLGELILFNPVNPVKIICCMLLVFSSCACFYAFLCGPIVPLWLNLLSFLAVSLLLATGSYFFVLPGKKSCNPAKKKENPLALSGHKRLLARDLAFSYAFSGFLCWLGYCYPI